MMKKHLLILTFAAALFGSCSDNTEPQEPIKPKPEPPIEKTTFKANVLKQEWDNIDFEIVPSNDKASYYFALRPTIECLQLTDKQLLESILAHDAATIDTHTKQGTTTIQRVAGQPATMNYHPNTSYTLLVFGYDATTHKPTTEPARFTMRTAQPDGDPAACTFKVTFSEVTANGVKVDLIPSNPKLLYTWDLMHLTSYEAYKNVMKLYVETLVEESTPEEIYHMATFGEVHQVFPNVLTPQTSYVLWAVCIDEKGAPTAEVYVSEPFTSGK
ncbi:MAG: hypothetical protein RR298_00575 [Alistipes sp.]